MGTRLLRLRRSRQQLASTVSKPELAVGKEAEYILFSMSRCPIAWMDGNSSRYISGPIRGCGETCMPGVAFPGVP